MGEPSKSSQEIGAGSFIRASVRRLARLWSMKHLVAPESTNASISSCEKVGILTRIMKEFEALDEILAFVSRVSEGVL